MVIVHRSLAGMPKLLTLQHQVVIYKFTLENHAVELTNKTKKALEKSHYVLNEFTVWCWATFFLTLLCICTLQVGNTFQGHREKRLLRITNMPV